MIVLYLKLAHGIILGQFVIAPHIRFGHWNIKKCHFIMEKCHRIIRLHKNCTWMRDSDVNANEFDFFGKELGLF